MTDDSETIEAELVEADALVRRDDLAAQNRGDIQMIDADTDEEVVRMWLRSTGSKHTREAYERDYQQAMDVIDKPLRMWTVSDLHDFEDHLRGREDITAESTVVRKLNSLKSLISYAHRMGYLRVNVGAAYDKPSPDVDEQLEVHHESRNWPTESEVRKMLAIASGRDLHVIRLLYYTAARVSEACAMTWGDWFEGKDDRMTVHIIGKGRKSRDVPVPDRHWERLVQWRSDDWSADDPCLAGREGALGRQQVGRIVRRIAKWAGIDDKPISPHSLRHAHATHAIDAGAPLHLVQKRLGHASITTTQKYVHARDSDTSASYLIE